MRKLGYTEGTHFTLEGGEARINNAGMPAVAAELVRNKVDIIVAFAGASVIAARKATTSIPIVFIGVNDPVEEGFATSLARPGGNITGIANLLLDLSLKRLELLRLFVPKLSRIALLTHTDAAKQLGTTRSALDSIQATAEKLDMQVVRVSAASADEIERAFAIMVRERVEGLIVMPALPFYNQRQNIVQLAAKHMIPAIYWIVAFVEEGGLMSYGNSTLDDFRHLAIYVAKIIKGANPAELPIEQPTKFELVINRKSAAAIRLAIPQELILRADKVIE
jgi:putative ABC transport system substrate-binding protein